ncbi:VPS35 endosomal protein-sorting factor-like isoform X2 [Homarus americanus]|uniref:VPS35 endosomal protein-sorting factor-like isoform X2 n=1 Tax=Homarus americanus TaxID=6706 RepID=UPI001C48EE2E|nr:VPS35 endosomal protein-sorting factor-like isoform X2 [Homarus americanus]
MLVVWKVAARQWGLEKKPLISKPTTSHPLQGVKDRTLKHAGSPHDKRSRPVVQPIMVDPLSSVLDGPDPLSDLLGAPDPLSGKNFLSTSRQGVEDIQGAEMTISDSRYNTWEQYRAFILSNFTTTGTLTFTSSFLQPSDSAESRAVPSQRRVVKTQTAVTERHRAQGMSGSERIRARLEQMDTLDEISGGVVREVGGLTQEEFTHRLFGLKQELNEAWQSDQRIKALKIGIQCVKLLSLSAPEHFYPSKFILVMEILDTLAFLVYQRLKQKYQDDSPSVSGGSTGKQEAQETARNWFYKVASIRELLPRLYLEAALLPCYSVIDMQEGELALSRISRMIRGIGDPLMAAYARMYLCRMGIEVAPTLTQYISESIEDFLHALKQGLWPEGEADMNMGEDKDALAARLFSPPLEWMMQCLATRAPHHVLQSILRQCESGEGLGQNLLVGAVLTMFPHHFIALQALPLTHLIAGCSYPGKKQHELLSVLGSCVNQVAPPQQQQLPLLNAVWKLITRIPETKDYLSTAGVWLEFTAKNFTSVEVNTLLGDVLKHVGTEGSHEQVHYPALLALVSTALTNSTDSHALFSMNNFLGLLNVFQRDSVSAGDGVTRGVVEALLAHHPGDFTDPTLVQHLLTLCGALHDSINALTTDDERRQLSQLIISFIRQVNFGRDFEQHLDFYVNSRAAFSNLDPVLVSLVQCVCRLAMATWSVMHGQHSGKTAAFVRACAAYCFITIPSLTSSAARLRLYLLSGAVALLNNCLGQGDACMKAAIREVVEVDGSQDTETAGQVAEILRLSVANLASTLIATPDPPDASPPLYLLRGLTNAVRSNTWQKDTDIQVLLSISLLHALSAASQDNLPYHIHSVEGNDSLYGGDIQVQQEAEQLCTTLLQDILSHIQGLTGIHEKRCGPLALGLFWCIVTWCDLRQPQMMNVASLMWSLVLKHNRREVVTGKYVLGFHVVKCSRPVSE